MSEAIAITSSVNGFSIDDPADVVDRILASTIPVLLEHQGEGEQQRRLPQPVADALIASGAFMAQAPQSLGGLELPPAQVTRLVEELSRVDASAGFVVGNMNSQAYAMLALSEEGAREVFAEPGAVIGGGAFPPAQAIAVPGGYRITGRAAFASGAHIATWVTAFSMLVEDGAPKMSPQGMPIMLLAVLRQQDCELIDTWRTMGLRGTGSHDFAYDNVFVPESRVAALSLGEPNPLFSGPVFKARLWSGHPSFAATALGVARAALDEGFTLARTKRANFMMQTLGDSSSVQRLLGKAEARLRAARAYLYETVEELWAHQLTGEFVTSEHAVDMQLAASHAIETAREVTELVHEAAGSTGFQQASPLEKLFRDAHTMSQHAFASQTRYESAVKEMLGKPNDWMFFQL